MAEPTVPVPVSREVIVAALYPRWTSVRWNAERAADDIVAALLSQPTPTAEPPRIEDMAPGTTFTARFRHTARLALFVKVGGKTHWPTIDIAEGALATYTVDAIDPSTIRDVTPPAGA